MKKLNSTITVKTLVCCVAILLISIKGQAQFLKAERDAIRIGVCTGLNNPAGGLGFTASFPLIKHFALNTGVGGGTWGTKAYFGTTYYIDHVTHTWALTTGVTQSFLDKEATFNMETVGGKKEYVTLKLYPQTNLYFAAVKYWDVGKNYNRLYLSLGWSQRLSDKTHSIVSGAPLPTGSDKMIRRLAPGGMLLGFGFELGTKRK